MQAQYELTERCIQILAIPDGKIPLILDIGCGSGLSGEVLTEHGYYWVGFDISKSMLEICNDNGSEGDLIIADMGQGVPFRSGVFDYAISVSAIQWLCNAEKSSHNPFKRLKRFFQTLYQSLTMGARCCFQFYPENPMQMDIITNSALESGFTGGVVVDFPHSAKAKKYYLFLQAGYTQESLEEVMKTIPKLTNEKEDEESEDQIKVEKGKTVREKRKNRNKKAVTNSKEWIDKMKIRQGKQGKTVRHDSKYSGRTRKGHHM
jgi:18S rRNA (guanine1575-N7)-methyltransferase